jgi:hypothetical protein
VGLDTGLYLPAAVFYHPRFNENLTFSILLFRPTCLPLQVVGRGPTRLPSVSVKRRVTSDKRRILGLRLFNLRVKWGGKIWPEFYVGEAQRK